MGEYSERLVRSRKCQTASRITPRFGACAAEPSSNGKVRLTAGLLDKCDVALEKLSLGSKLVALEQEVVDGFRPGADTRTEGRQRALEVVEMSVEAAAYR